MLNLLRDLLLLDLAWQIVKRLLQIALLVALGFVVYFVFRGEGLGTIVSRLGYYLGAAAAVVTGRAPPTPQPSEAPPDFRQVIPEGWAIERIEPVNVDGDSETEWLLIYRYDQTKQGFGGPLGGVIYDPQPDRDPAELAAQIPYRPSSYIPYQLLPRYGGTGYLGERVRSGNPAWPIVQTYDADGDGQPELEIQGFSGYDFPTYFSVFKWTGDTGGYLTMIQPPEEVIWADAGIDVQVKETTGEDGQTVLGPIESVTARRQLLTPVYYFRSQLCRRIVYRWNGIRTALRPADYSLDFCFGRPAGATQPGLFRYAVFYPEEALLAHYEDGLVEEISVPVTGQDQITIDAIVRTKHAGEMHWQLIRESEGGVAEMTVWRMQQF